MRIARVRIQNFRGLGSCYEKTLSEPMTIFLGDNETGKSSLQEAILTGLFGDAQSKSAEHRGQRSWQTGQDPRIEIELVSDGKSYLLVRDFPSGTNSLTLPEGKVLRDKGRVQETLNQLLGFPSKESYIGTACIRQGEIDKQREEAGEIQKLLEASIGGGGDMPPSEVLKNIKKRRDELEAGKRGGAKRGQVTDLREQETSLTKEVKEINQKINEQYDQWREYNKILQELPSKKNELESLENAFNKASLYRQKKREYDETQSRLKEVVDAIESRRENEKRLQGLKKELELRQQEFEPLEKRWEKAEEAQNRLEELKEKKKQLTELDHLVKELQKIESSLTDIVNKLNQVPEIDRIEFQNALQLPAEIRGHEITIETQGMALEVEPLHPLPLTIRADGQEYAFDALASRYALEAKQEISIQIPDIAEIRVTNTQDISETVKDIRRKKDVLGTILQKYRVASLDELKGIKEKRDGLLREKEGYETKKRFLLGNRTQDGLTAEITRLDEEIRDQEEKQAGLLGAALDEEQLTQLRESVGSLKTVIDTLAGQIQETDRNLKNQKTLKELEEDKDALVSRASIAEEGWKRVEAYECAPEKLEELRVKKEKGEKELKHLEFSRERLEGVLASRAYAVEELDEGESKLQDVKTELSRYQRRLEVDHLVDEFLNRARQETVTDGREAIKREADEYLSSVTGAKYAAVTVEPDLSFKIFSPDKGDWIDPAERDSRGDLSGGTIDQLYLAARLAITDYIVGHRRPPLIVDDPFVYFDPHRKQEAFKILERFAQRYQVIFLTCSPYDLPQEVPGKVKMESIP